MASPTNNDSHSTLNNQNPYSFTNNLIESTRSRLADWGIFPYEQPGDYYQNAGGVWGEDRTGASLTNYAKRHQEAASDNRVIKIYPGIKPQNSLQLLDKKRQNPAYTSTMVEAIKTASSAPNTNIDPADIGLFESSLNTFFDASKNNLRSGDDDSSPISRLNRNLDMIKARSKGYPKHANVNGGSKRELETVLRNARNELMLEHARMAKNYVQQLTPDSLEALDRNLAQYLNNPRISAAQKARYTALSPDAQRIRFAQKELLAPAFKKELSDFEQINAEVREDFSTKPLKNLEWARICAMQDPFVLKKAQERVKNRAEAARARALKVDVNESAGAFAVESGDKNLSVAVNNNAPLSVGIGAKVPTTNRLMPNPEEEMDPDALPTLQDFLEVLKENPNKRFQFDKNLHMPGKGGKIGKSRGGIQLSLDSNGNLCLNFPKKTPQEIENSRMVFDATANLIETIWLNDNRPDNEKTIDLNSSNIHYAKVAARAALARGYSFEQINVSYKDEKGVIKTLKAEDFPELDRVRQEMKKYKDFMAQPLENAVPDAISRIPLENINYPFETNLNSDLDKEAQYKQYLQEYEKTFDLYEDDYNRKKETLNEIRRVLESPNATEEEIEKAIAKLNSIPLSPEVPQTKSATSMFGGAVRSTAQAALYAGGAVVGGVAGFLAGGAAGGLVGTATTIPGATAVGGSAGALAGMAAGATAAGSAAAGLAGRINPVAQAPGNVALSAKNLDREKTLAAIDSKLQALEQNYNANTNKLNQIRNNAPQFEADAVLSAPGRR